MTFDLMTEGLDLSMGAVLTSPHSSVAIVSLASGSMFPGPALQYWSASRSARSTAGCRHPRIPPFVATLGTLGMAQGLSLIVSDGQSVVGIPPQRDHIYSAVVLAYR